MLTSISRKDLEALAKAAGRPEAKRIVDFKKETTYSMGVDAFKASEVTLRFRIKTLPLKQWEVGRELRRRIKKSFDAEKISIPSAKLDVMLTNRN